MLIIGVVFFFGKHPIESRKKQIGESDKTMKMIYIILIVAFLSVSIVGAFIFYQQPQFIFSSPLPQQQTGLGLSQAKNPSNFSIQLQNYLISIFLPMLRLVFLTVLEMVPVIALQISQVA